MKPTIFNHIIDYPPLCNVHGECSKWVIEWLYIGGYFNYIQHTSAPTSFLCIYDIAWYQTNLWMQSKFWRSAVFTYFLRPPGGGCQYGLHFFSVSPECTHQCRSLHLYCFQDCSQSFIPTAFILKTYGHMGCSADLIYFRAKITSPDITLFSSFLFISFIPIILKT